MAVGALVTSEAIRRAEIIDAEMGWDSCLAIGHLVRLWNEAQEGGGKSVVKKRVILEWARVPADEGDRFIELCCQMAKHEDDDHIHFLEHRGEDRYFIVGNPDRVEKLEGIREQRRGAGLASGDKRRKAADERKLNENRTGRSTVVPTPVEQNANPIPIPTQLQKPDKKTFESVCVVDARTLVDPPDPPPTKKILKYSPPMTVEKLVGGGCFDFNPDTAFWHRVAAEFAASGFLNGHKPGSDGGTFACADPIVWAIKRADEIAAGKYRDRPPKKKAARWVDVADRPVDPNAPTGFNAEEKL